MHSLGRQFDEGVLNVYLRMFVIGVLRGCLPRVSTHVRDRHFDEGVLRVCLRMFVIGVLPGCSPHVATRSWS